MRPLDERPAAGLNRAEFEAEVLPRFEPLVLRGLVAHWPGVQVAAQGDEALADWLRGHASPVDVDAVMLPPDQGRRIGYRDGVGPGFNFLRNRLPLADLLNQIQRYTAFRHAPAVAAQSAPLAECAPTLVDTHSLPFWDEGQAPARLWLGNTITTPAHVDESHNVACVVAASAALCSTRRRPSHTFASAPSAKDRRARPSPWSTPRPSKPRKCRAQREAHALAREALLGPGDAIYIPPLWWHHVASQRPLNLLFNFCGHARPQAASGLDALLHTLLALQALPEAERAAWRTLFEHWVFSATPSASRTCRPACVVCTMAWAGVGRQRADAAARQAGALSQRVREELDAKQDLAPQGGQ